MKLITIAPVITLAITVIIQFLIIIKTAINLATIPIVLQVVQAVILINTLDKH